MSSSVRSVAISIRKHRGYTPVVSRRVAPEFCRSPVTEEAAVDNNGRFTLKGYFDTSPSRVYYDLAYILSGDEWQLMQITINLKKPDGK
jgi:hypothetical protein